MSRKSISEILSRKSFVVEHAINMHATRFFYLPAANIYQKDALKPHMNLISRCHIYMVGFVPIIRLVDACQSSRMLILNYSILEKKYELEFELPSGTDLIHEKDRWYLTDATKRHFSPSENSCFHRLRMQCDDLRFLVKYIGQSYGNDGERSALNRLTKHETLQKISLKGAPDGYRLELLLLEIEPNNQIITLFNPWAEDDKSSDDRISQGLQKLFNTTEKERVSLYEAAMIRYFNPEYNVEFKNSFPSTKLKVLQDCYHKDFAAVSAELAHDELPITLYSETVAPCDMHIAHFSLHTEEARRVFFAK